MENKFTCLLLLSLFISACGGGITPLPAHMEQPATMTMDQTSTAESVEMTAIPNDSGISGVEIFPDRTEYHAHVNVIETPEGNIPPVFGEHFPAWQNCGIYDQPVNVGNALHSMEHGAVWLTYRPDLDKALIAGLQALVRGHDYVLMSPYPTQTSDLIMTAWGVRLIIDSIPDERVEKFIKYYEEGPQNPEPGAPCDGAVGTPIE